MPVESITKDRFQELAPGRGPLGFVAAEEKNWFTHDAGYLMGTLSWDRSEKEWNYAVLGRDQHGTYRWIQGGKSIATQDEAQQRLAETMERVAATGTKVFPKH